MFKICFYVPETHLDNVKNAMFEAGAGRIGQYQHCCWQMLGEGQFMPLANHHAYIGTEGVLEKLAEYKVEMVCEDNIVKEVIYALKKSHPYETPAYHAWRIEDF